MSDPDNHYELHAGEVLDAGDMAASVANTEQGYDVDEAVRHNLYIGWLLGAVHDRDVELRFAGGNRLKVVHDERVIGLVVVPFPPAEWHP